MKDYAYVGTRLEKNGYDEVADKFPDVSVESLIMLDENLRKTFCPSEILLPVVEADLPRGFLVLVAAARFS